MDQQNAAHQWSTPAARIYHADELSMSLTKARSQAGCCGNPAADLEQRIARKAEPSLPINPKLRMKIGSVGEFEITDLLRLIRFAPECWMAA
jgi:hypothetical protein